MNKQEKNEIVDTAIQWMGKTPLEERLDIEHYVEAALRAREEQKSDVQRAEEYLEARLKEVEPRTTCFAAERYFEGVGDLMRGKRLGIDGSIRRKDG